MALNSLPLFHRVSGQRVVVLGDGDAADAKRRLVERAGGICCGEPEAHHARLAFVAIDDAKTGEAAAIRLRCKGLLVNVTDRPELCDFTVPSILDRDPVIVAVGTGGASAGLAKQLRLRLEGLLPPSLGALASALSDARDALRTRWPGSCPRARRSACRWPGFGCRRRRCGCWTSPTPTSTWTASNWSTAWSRPTSTTAAPRW